MRMHPYRYSNTLDTGLSWDHDTQCMKQHPGHPLLV